VGKKAKMKTPLWVCLFSVGLLTGNYADAELVARSVESGGYAFYRQGGDTPILVQNARPDFRPYIHPILAPDGNGVVTENSPKHHPWQHGLYVGLHQVNGINFWEKEIGLFHPQPMAAPVVSGDEAAWSVTTLWTATNGAPQLTETQAWSLTDCCTYYRLDMVWTLKAEQDVDFGKYAYGGLFLRMPFKGKGTAVNSEGLENRAAESQRARWVTVSMPIEGRTNDAMTAILDHPANPCHPNPWRVDGQLGIAPSRCIAGPWRLVKGEESVNRYRVIVCCGGLDRTLVEREWSLFAGRP
jgi:hypothetical protein